MKVTKEKSISKGKYEAEVPILWPPDAKSQLTGKDPDAGQDWRQEEKGTIEDKTVGWHYNSMDRSLSEGDQSWVFTGRTDAEAETPILWLPDVNSWLIRKDPDAGRDWGQEEKGKTEDEMVGWHHQLNGHEFEQDGEGQGSLVCFSPWGHKELDTTEQLNNNILNSYNHFSG